MRGGGTGGASGSALRPSGMPTARSYLGDPTVNAGLPPAPLATTDADMLLGLVAVTAFPAPTPTSDTPGFSLCLS